MAFWAAALVVAGCEPARELSTWPIALRQVVACPVGAASEIELFALGDFPSRSYQLRAGTGDELLDDVPLDVREILVSVSVPGPRGVAEGRSVRSVRQPRTPGGDSSMPDKQALWVLQRGLSCPLGDEFLSASEGAVVVGLAQGGALIAGGLDTDLLASSVAYLLVEGSETRADVEGGMLLRRAFASASLVGEVVVIAGGTADRRAGAHDTWELFEPASSKFVAARSGKLKAPRMQHAAVVLADGRVLLVGGRAEADGAPLATAELLDPVGGLSEKLADRSLSAARSEPSAFMLDSGKLLVAAGRDERGQVIGSVELYSPDERRFTLALSELPVRAEVAVAALPGARAAWLACDHADAGGGASCQLSLISERDGALSAAPVALDFAGLAQNGLKEMRLVYAGAGQLLWTGADDSDPTGRRRAFVIDPATASLARVDASRVPSQLVRLRNDLIAELDRAGVSLRAAFTRGRYASPQGNVLEDAQQSLAFDAPGHWLWQEEGVQALAEGARVDVGELRFAGFHATLSVMGSFSVLVYDGAGRGAQLSVRSGELQVAGAAGCSSRLQDGAAVELHRRGARLTFPGTDCGVEVPDAPLGLGLVLERGAVLRELRVARE